ncbi:MAG TPA: ribonuclease PH, partial [Candidatus Omnitrophota bacterium]|nr:ribonuclease PH [Candidatus Omnitrophota bacterium]
ALKHLKKQKMIQNIPLQDYVAAVSVGIVDGTLMLDLNYEEDSRADVDMNVVMLGRGDFVEVQGTAEREPFSKAQVNQMLTLAKQGIQDLIRIQKRQLGALLP